MNKIGFKNFRRFQTFEPLECKGITFLVGRNNAGKSTLVKALLLIDNYFKSSSIDIFSFGNNVLEDANIVTYGRAKNLHASENFIHFTQEIENYLIELTVSGEDNKAFANVHSLTITDLYYNLSFIFNLQNRFIRIVKSRNRQVGKAENGFIADLEAQVSETKKQLEEPGLKKTSYEYIELVSRLENLHEKLAVIHQEENDPNQDTILFSLVEDFGTVNSLTEIVDDLLLHSISQYEREFLDVQNGEKPSDSFEDLRALKELDPIFVESSFSHFMTLMSDFSIAYMGANPAKQSALFAIRDKNNALAQAIHEYKQLNIADGEEEHRFVLKWMQEFEVGDDFTISMHAGEAYEMKIRSNNSEIHLADKGMGSIQAMLLLMRIACVIKRIRLAEKNSTITRIVEGKEVRQDSSNYRLIDNTTVIIEEPELNLHPALQSRLADLFLYVNQPPFNLNFIIETHSEYILRRSQVLVAENEFEVAPNENPFCVYYFPKEYGQIPYQLNYQSDGTFDKNFGTGFFDTASLDTLKLLRIKKREKGMMQIFSDIQPFETIVLYPEKYPNWFKLFSEHCKVFINMSDDDYEVEKLTNPVLEEFIKLNTGREPIPLKYHFDSVYADSGTVASTPRAVYFLDISKIAAKEIQQNFGILIQSIEAIDDCVLRNTFYRNLPINKLCNANGKAGWQHLLENQLPPLNTIVISDNFLFANEDGIRGFKNVVQLIQSVLPDTLNTDFNILLIAQEHKNKDVAWCNKLTDDIKSAINNLNKPYNIIFEIVFAETVHKRIAISNYFTITTDKGFAIFKSDDLTTVHEDTEIQIDRVFHRINKNEGDTEYLNAEYSLDGIKKICATVAEYISKRPNDKNYRILGDCNVDKSLKNRLINDV